MVCFCLFFAGGGHEIRQPVALFVLAGCHIHVALEYLDEIALRAETQQTAYLEVGILGESQQTCCLLDFFAVDVIAECHAGLGFEKT